MAQAAAQAHLAAYALGRDGVEPVEDLDRHLLAELAVVGEPHHALAAVAEEAERGVALGQAQDEPLDRGPVERLRLRLVLFPRFLARHAGPLPPSAPTPASYTRASPTPRLWERRLCCDTPQGASDPAVVALPSARLRSLLPVTCRPRCHSPACGRTGEERHAVPRRGESRGTGSAAAWRPRSATGSLACPAAGRASLACPAEGRGMAPFFSSFEFIIQVTARDRA